MSLRQALDKYWEVRDQSINSREEPEGHMHQLLNAQIDKRI